MRSIAAILLAIAVAVEIYFMADFKPPRFLIPSPQNETRQNTAIEQHMEKYMLIIGATVLVGGIVVFSLPARRRKE